MTLVAVAWIYVVLLMAVAEAISPQGSLLGALVTFVLYGVLPLSIVLYIMSTPARRKRRRLTEAATFSPAAPDRSGHAAGDAVPPEGKEG